MDKKIKQIYLKLLKKYDFDFSLGEQIYEADHWAWQYLEDYIGTYNYIKLFIYDKKIKEDYKKYSIKRCHNKFKMSYCPICSKFLNNSSWWKRLRYKIHEHKIKKKNGNIINTVEESLNKIESISRKIQNEYTKRTHY